MPTYFFRIKEHRGKKYLYKVHSKRIKEKPYPVQKNMFVGNVDKILQVMKNAAIIGSK